MENFKKILGIDPGYGRLGWAVISKTNGKERVEESGCVETSSQDAHETRLLIIGEKLNKIISRSQPEAIAVENLFFTANQKTAMKVSEARGVVIYEAGKAGLPIKELTPLQVKTAVCGHGKADKKQVELMVKALLQLEQMPKYDDETDAVAVALAAFAYGNKI